MLCVRPGVLEAKARRFCCVSVLMQVDLPALERPTKAISGVVRRQELQPRSGGEEARRVQPAQRQFGRVLGCGCGSRGGMGLAPGGL
jgi:hypothetical protein